VAELVALFGEVRRVLKDDGTLWLNLGDSYSGSGKGAWSNAEQRNAHKGEAKETYVPTREEIPLAGKVFGKAKDLLGIPWRVAFALQSDGWYLRSDIIWHKPNPMPESVTDRPTKAHEYVFLLSKSARYFYDADAIREPVAPSQVGRIREDVIGGKSHVERGQHSKGGVYKSGNKERTYGEERGRPDSHIGGNVPWEDDGTGRNARSVWSITTRPFKGSHFATMPPELARRCILAGSKPGDMVLDPFGGAGTTGLVADRLGRDATLIELNPTYAAIARERIAGDAPLFADVQSVGEAAA
jgi:DNA modification methylase